MNRFPGIVTTLFSALLLAACSGGGGSSSGLSPGDGGSSPLPNQPSSPQSGAPDIALTTSSMTLPFGFSSSGYDSNKLKEFVQVSDNDMQLSTTITVGGLSMSTVPPDRPGTYSVRYTITNAQGEIDTATLTITVEPPRIELLGDAYMFLSPNTLETFSDPGARILSLMTTIEGEVPDELKLPPPYGLGSYEIPYRYTYQTATGEEVEITALRTVQITPVIADLKVLTRVHGISPETVYFSAADSRPLDPADCVDFSGTRGDESEEALIACSNGQYFGYHFNFDDPDSGNFTFPDAPVAALTARSKNRQVGGAPRAIHTFECEGAGNSRWDPELQSCHFKVGVRVQAPDGLYADDWVDVYIRPQHVAFSAADTYCISHDGNFSGCPAGVPGSNQLDRTPDVGSFSGKRVLFKRRASITDTLVYDPVCIGYEESNVRIDSFGSGLLPPVIQQVAVGVDTGCNDTAPTNSRAQNYPPLTFDENGHVTQGWAYGVSVANLRLGSIKAGMSATLLTMHNLDLDWSADARFDGYVEMSNAGTNCEDNSGLSCSYVHYPYGIFLSEVDAKGHINNLPPVNVGCFNSCGIVNSGIIGTEVKTAVEHNVRIMGSWGLVVSNSWLRGNHIGGNGPKARLSLRQLNSDTPSSKTADPTDPLAGNHAGDGPGHIRGEGSTLQYSPHFNTVVDSWFDDVLMHPQHDSSGMVDIWSGQHFAGVFGATFFTYPGAESNPTQFFLGGRNTIALDTTFNGFSVTCRTNNVNGSLHSSDSYYYDQDRIWVPGECGSMSPAAFLPPSPDQPGSN